MYKNYNGIGRILGLTFMSKLRPLGPHLSSVFLVVEPSKIIFLI